MKTRNVEVAWQAKVEMSEQAKQDLNDSPWARDIAVDELLRERQENQ